MQLGTASTVLATISAEVICAAYTEEIIIAKHTTDNKQNERLGDTQFMLAAIITQ